MPKITLTGEQKLVLSLPVKNPVLIRGAAGSGKTTVAVYRAMHLLETQNDLFTANTVVILSYTNSLVNYVRELIEEHPCSVSTLHSIAGSLLHHAGIYIQVEKDNVVRDQYVQAAITQARAKHGNSSAVMNKPVAFYSYEIKWIKGRRIQDLATYRATARIGRGTADRVTTQDKELLWTVFEVYNQKLAETHKGDYEDLILHALSYAETENFVPPFTHIVVDEAQDFTFAQLKLVSKLVSPETNSITLVADSAQRIYQSGFSWAETGLAIHGSRSVDFSRNYRNTRQIAAAAYSILNKEVNQADFSRVELPTKEGEKPRLVLATTFSQQLKCVLDVVRDPARIGSVAIAAPTRQCVKKLEAELTNANINWRNLNNCDPAIQIVLDTMYAVKGIEFDQVILCDLNEGTLKASPGVDEEDAQSRLRKLIYVGMTRARHKLTMCTSGTPSILLGDIDSTTLTIQKTPYE